MSEEMKKFEELTKSQKITSCAQMFFHAMFTGVYAKHVSDCVSFLDSIAVEAKIEENRVDAVRRCVLDEVFGRYKIALKTNKTRIASELGCPEEMDDAQFAASPYELQERYKDLAHMVLEETGRWEEYRDEYLQNNKAEIDVLTVKYQEAVKGISLLDFEAFVAAAKAFAEPTPKLEVVK